RERDTIGHAKWRVEEGLWRNVAPPPGARREVILAAVVFFFRASRASREPLPRSCPLQVAAEVPAVDDDRRARHVSRGIGGEEQQRSVEIFETSEPTLRDADRKSTRLNSSHVKSSYAVFCLK